MENQKEETFEGKQENLKDYREDDSEEYSDLRSDQPIVRRATTFASSATETGTGRTTARRRCAEEETGTSAIGAIAITSWTCAHTA